MCEACEALDYGIYDMPDIIDDDTFLNEDEGFFLDARLDETEEEHQERMIEDEPAAMEFAAGYFNDPVHAPDYVPSLDDMITSNQAFKAKIGIQEVV